MTRHYKNEGQGYGNDQDWHLAGEYANGQWAQDPFAEDPAYAPDTLPEDTAAYTRNDAYQSRAYPGSQSRYGYGEPQGPYGQDAQTTAYMPPAYQQRGGAGDVRPVIGMNRGYSDATTQTARRGLSGTTIAAILLLVIGVGLLVTAILVFITTQRNYQVGTDEYSALSANVTEGSGSTQPVVDFAALKAINTDIVGWVQIPGTKINYPVTRRENDNDYYLKHTFMDTENLAGSVYMDSRCSPDMTSRNTVLYGHHLQNGMMFASIADFSDQAQFDQIPVIYYISQDGTVHDYAPLCCMVVNGYDVDSLQFSFSSQEEFTAYVQSTIDRSSARAPWANVGAITHLLMLSTCSYEHQNDRTILVCAERNEMGGGGTTDASGNMEQIRTEYERVTG